MKPLADIIREINAAHRPGTIEHADALVTALQDERAHVIALAGVLRQIAATGYATVEGQQVVTATSSAHERCCRIAMKALAAYESAS